MTRSEIIGQNILKYRTSIGMSQVDFAAAIGRSQTMVSMYEKGQRQPSTKILVKIADVLGVPFGNVYYSPDEHEPEEEWYDHAFGPDAEERIAEKEMEYTAPKTSEARIVSGWVDMLPKENREQVLAVVRAMILNNPNIFKE